MIELQVRTGKPLLYHQFFTWHQKAQAGSRSRLERHHADFQDYMRFLVSLYQARDLEQHARTRLNSLVTRIKRERTREAQQAQLASAMSRRVSMRSLTLALRLWSDVAL